MKTIKDFNKLYDEHVGIVRSILYRMCPRQDLDDLTQECFIKAWKNIDSFRGDSSFATWIRRIAVHVAYDYYRRRAVRPQTEELDETTQTEVARGPLEDLLNKQLVQNLFETLDADHRSVLVLHVLEELSLEEVASILEIKIGTVKSRLFYAREAARKFLISKGVDYGS
ncbi:MAG: sigma-70 family RNA polymerase sigma factor [Proteobacteria bacterium]|nr:sigma-70 family RNA polymerase sigma factor [Pseudomonadota bacterium]